MKIIPIKCGMYLYLYVLLMFTSAPTFPMTLTGVCCVQGKYTLLKFRYFCS